MIPRPQHNPPQVKEERAALLDRERRLKEAEERNAALAAAAAASAASGLEQEQAARAAMEQVGAGEAPPWGVPGAWLGARGLPCGPVAQRGHNPAAPSHRACGAPRASHACGTCRGRPPCAHSWVV